MKAKIPIRCCSERVALFVVSLSLSISSAASQEPSQQRVARLEAEVAELKQLLGGATCALEGVNGAAPLDGGGRRMLFQKSMDSKAAGYRQRVSTDDMLQFSGISDIKLLSWEAAWKLSVVLAMVVALSAWIKIIALFNVKPLHNENDVTPLTSEDGFSACDSSPMILDNMTYHMGWLKTWSVFNVATRTVWKRRSLWHAMGRLVILASTTGVVIYFEERYFSKGEQVKVIKGQFDAMKFSEINTMLNMFVTLMLSFFLSLSVQRWSACVNAYLGLVDSIKNLSMQMLVLGANQECIEKISRFGILSGIFLAEDMRSMEIIEKEAHKARMWEVLVKGDKSRLLYVTPEERKTLEPIQDCAAQMWIWVGSLIGRLAQDGEIPGMATPVYGRIMQLAQDGQESIRQVRASVLVRLPFIYMHMLSTLVQVNNIFFALTLGFTLGAMFGCDITRLDEAFIQVVIVTTLKCCMCPILYQACLELGISIAEPFAYGDGRIPILGMLMKLDKDLADARVMAENPPSWEVPIFNKPRAVG